MRTDSVGLFWEDIKVQKTGSRTARQRGAMPPIPETGWRPPTGFPNLSAATVIGFDTETYDPELLTAGPGWARGSGDLIGVSMSVQDGTSWYFPIGHQTQPEMNMDREQVLRFCKHYLETNIPKVGANLIYDCGWMYQYGIKVGGPLYDIQFAEALLNSEVPEVSLEALAQTHLGIGKETSILYEWLSNWLGGQANDRQRANLYLAPPSLAGPYAEADASLPIQILTKQWPKLEARGVLDLFKLECRQIMLLVKMRFKGAPVDINRAEEIHDKLGAELVAIEEKLKVLGNGAVNPNAGDSLAAAFTRLGLPIPTKVDRKSGERRRSFDAGILEDIDHPIAEAVLEHRRVSKVRNTFIRSYIIDKNVKGRIHCSFHPLKGSEGGARSGRYSSSDPNLQNIPVRTEIGKLVRKAFKGSGIWIKWDFSQIEYRMLAHFAVGPGADDVRRQYNQNPDIDYHDLTSELLFRLTGIRLPRRNVKNLNFGLIYGMGKPKLISDLGLSHREGVKVYNDYHEAAPFTKATMDAAAREVHNSGFVETILGRKSDFDSWTTKEFNPSAGSFPYAVARAKWGSLNIERAHTHKALNRKLQGSAADMMKKAMVDAYEAGLFEDDACGMPCLTVHDELDFDYTNGMDLSNPCWAEFKRVMEHALPQLRVPVRMDSSTGPSWGEAD